MLIARHKEHRFFQANRWFIGLTALLLAAFSLFPNPIVKPQPAKAAFSLCTQLDIVIALDTSQSMFHPLASNPSTSRFNEARKGINALITKFTGNSNIELGLVTFNDSVQLRSNLTPNFASIQDILNNKIKEPQNTGTKLGDGMIKGRDILFDPTFSRGSARKIMIVFSDGQEFPNSIDYAVDKANIVHLAGIEIFSIRIDSITTASDKIYTSYPWNNGNVPPYNPPLNSDPQNKVAPFYYQHYYHDKDVTQSVQIFTDIADNACKGPCNLYGGLDVVIALDTSNSMFQDPNRYRDAQNAVKAFVDQAQSHNGSDSNLNTRIALASFRDVAKVDAHLSDNYADLLTALGKYQQPTPKHFGTDIDSGLQVSKRELFSSNGRANARKAIIVFSDGHQTGSSDAVLESKKDRLAGIEVFSLQFGNEQNTISNQIYTNQARQVSPFNYTHFWKNPPDLSNTFEEIFLHFVKPCASAAIQPGSKCVHQLQEGVTLTITTQFTVRATIDDHPDGGFIADITPGDLSVTGIPKTVDETVFPPDLTDKKSLPYDVIYTITAYGREGDSVTASTKVIVTDCGELPPSKQSLRFCAQDSTSHNPIAGTLIYPNKEAAFRSPPDYKPTTDELVFKDDQMNSPVMQPNDITGYNTNPQYLIGGGDGCTNNTYINYYFSKAWKIGNSFTLKATAGGYDEATLTWKIELNSKNEETVNVYMTKSGGGGGGTPQEVFEVHECSQTGNVVGGVLIKLTPKTLETGPAIITGGDGKTDPTLVDSTQLKTGVTYSYTASKDKYTTLTNSWSRNANTGIETVLILLQKPSCPPPSSNTDSLQFCVYEDNGGNKGASISGARVYLKDPTNPDKNLLTSGDFLATDSTGCTNYLLIDYSYVKVDGNRPNYNSVTDAIGYKTTYKDWKRTDKVEVVEILLLKFTTNPPPDDFPTEQFKIIGCKPGKPDTIIPIASAWVDLPDNFDKGFKIKTGGDGLTDPRMVNPDAIMNAGGPYDYMVHAPTGYNDTSGKWSRFASPSAQVVPPIFLTSATCPNIKPPPPTLIGDVSPGGKTATDMIGSNKISHIKIGFNVFNLPVSNVKIHERLNNASWSTICSNVLVEPNVKLAPGYPKCSGQNLDIEFADALKVGAYVISFDAQYTGPDSENISVDNSIDDNKIAKADCGDIDKNTNAYLEFTSTTDHCRAIGNAHVRKGAARLIIEDDTLIDSDSIVQANDFIARFWPLVISKKGNAGITRIPPGNPELNVQNYNILPTSPIKWDAIQNEMSNRVKRSVQTKVAKPWNCPGNVGNLYLYSESDNPTTLPGPGADITHKGVWILSSPCNLTFTNVVVHGRGTIFNPSVDLTIKGGTDVENSSDSLGYIALNNKVNQQYPATMKNMVVMAQAIKLLDGSLPSNPGSTEQDYYTNLVAKTITFPTMSGLPFDVVLHKPTKINVPPLFERFILPTSHEEP